MKNAERINIVLFKKIKDTKETIELEEIKPLFSQRLRVSLPKKFDKTADNLHLQCTMRWTYSSISFSGKIDKIEIVEPKNQYVLYFIGWPEYIKEVEKQE